MLRRLLQNSSIREALSKTAAEQSLGKTHLAEVCRSLRTGTAPAFEDAAKQGVAAVASKAPSPPPGTSSNKGLASVPGLVKALGFGGALPFWIFSPAIAPSLPLDILDAAIIPNAGMLQIGYGATIISFLGGVHWGLAMTSLTPLAMTGQRYIWSVIPCLMAWPTLAMPVQQAAGIQAALLGVVYMVDRGWAGRGGLPPWYMSLRLPLTVLAIGGLAMTAATEGDRK